MAISQQDREILRELGRQVAEIAALPAQQETISLWKSLNGLRPRRPMVRIDQICWHEMDVDDELKPRSEDKFCRALEGGLRRTLYLWRHLPVDMVVQPFLEMGRAIRNSGFGISVDEERRVSDPANSVVSHRYHDLLKTDEDLAKIRTPQVSEDKEATARTRERVGEIFAGVLGARMCGTTLFFSPWDAIVQWRGAEAMLMDLAERPEFMHRIMGRTTEAYLSMLDQLEAQGLLEPAQSTIHCTGAHSDELPAAGFDPNRPRARDAWTAGMAQIFSSVSVAMHKEFELDYAVKWYERFGLVYYGCCEPLDGKIDIIRAIPHVRKISMSPWVNLALGAERIGRDFVFSRKPNPAFLAGDDWDIQLVERDLRETARECRKHGCPLEFILKDISTVRYQPRRLWEWAEAAMRVAKESPARAGTRERGPTAKSGRGGCINGIAWWGGRPCPPTQG